MSESILALEPSLYTDPEIFRREQASVLAKTWQFAGHVSQLEKPGDYFTCQVAGENIVCLKDEANEIRAFYNVCQHRAHELVNGSGCSRLLVCPYHSWSYELNGRLKSAPNSETTATFDRSKIALKEVRHEVFLGFIFINLDPGTRPMDEWYPGVREELLPYVPGIERLKPVLWNDIPENCNWKVSIENYSECYHCPVNHPALMSGVVKPETYDIQPQGHCLRHKTECQNLDKMSYEIDLDSNEYAGKYSTWYLWPMFSFQVYPGNILNTYHWRTDRHDRVTVTRGWFTEGGEESKTIRELAQQDLDTTVAEDIGLVESVNRGLHSRGYEAGQLVIDPAGGLRSEHSLHAMQNWYRELL